MYEDGLTQGIPPSEMLEQARQAYDRRAWREAHALFAAADSLSPLAPDDLERCARTAALLGDDERYVDLLGRASQLWADEGEWARAAECTCYLAMNLSFRGQWGPASGWWSRAQQQMDAVGGDCPARALLIASQAIQVMLSGEAIKAIALFEEALVVARRCADLSLAALAGAGIGQCLVSMGNTDEGLRRLDEVMVSVIADELNPIVTGIIYCAVIDACQEGYDARRAGEWTQALTRWCEAQPDLIRFRGQCLIHRAQIMQLRGHWPDAMEQIAHARERLSQPPHPAIGAAHFEQAEIYRLRGDFVRADQAYELAASFGHEVQPGLALLRMAQGKVDQARTGISRALQETDGALRPKLLAAGVEVAIAADELATARAHDQELREIAAARDSLLLTAMSAQSSGSIQVATGHPAEALPTLRRAWKAWQELEAPYFAARVRALVGQACQDLADVDAARMEFEAARSMFARLGAQPDLQRLGEPAGGGLTLSHQPAGLTGREVEVLRQVASGKTNRAIATELFLSEKTVARHISNIFNKLQVSSRAAATAYAYEHDLV